MTLVASVCGFVVSVLATRLVEIAARRRSFLDVPNPRSSHVTPTPRLGGIGILAGSLVGIGLGTGGAIDVDLVVRLGAGLLLAFVGLIDDLRHISVVTKQGTQLVVAGIAAWTLAPSLDVELAGLALSIDGPIAMVLTVLWITALINAFNFIDGIDGMTGGLVIVVAVVGLGITADSVHPILLAVAAATAGFLVWNVHPASVFMGDVGSQYLGYWVGLTLLVQPDGQVGVIPLLILLAPLLFDTGFTLLRRARARENLFAAHRTHLYQRLVTAGVGQRTVSIGYAIACGLCGLVALAYPSVGPIAQVAGALAVLVAGAVFARFVSGQSLRRAAAEGD